MLDNPKTGLFNVNAYQCPGLPWVTSSIASVSGSPTRFDFPKVTQFIVISNRDSAANSLSFGFTRNGISGSSNKFVLNAGQSMTLNVMVKEIYIQGEVGAPSYSLFAGLTVIDASQLPLLSGSSGSNQWNGVG